jgi:hypothetical protein
MNELSSHAHGAPQNDRKVPELEAKAAALAVERDAVAIEDGDAVAEYVNLADTLSVLRAERRDVLNLPAHCVPFLQPGRLVRVCARDPKRVASAATRAGEDGGAASLAAAGVQTEWGVVVKHERDGGEYVVDVLCVVEEEDRSVASESRRDDEMGSAAGAKRRWKIVDIRSTITPTREPRVVPLRVSQIDRLSSVRVYLPKDMRPSDARARVQKSVVEMFKRDAFKGAFYTLVPIRPRSRGERRSLETFAGASLRPSLGFNPRPRCLSTPSDAFELHPDIALYGTTQRRRSFSRPGERHEDHARVVQEADAADHRAGGNA